MNGSSTDILGQFPAASSGELSDPMRTIFEAIVRVELENDAANLVISGVRVWPALRYYVFERILVASELTRGFQNDHQKGFRSYWQILSDVALRSPFLRPRRAQYLVVKWSRMQDVDGAPEDVASLALRRLLPAEDMLQIDTHHNISDPGPRSRSMQSVNLLSRIGAKLFPVHLDADAARKIAVLEEALLRETGVKIALRDWFVRFAADFRVRKKLLGHIIRSAGTKKVFVVVAYIHPALVAAAREAGVEVIELQHGLIHGLHLGYTCPPGIAPVYAPDTILLFGEHWRGTAQYAPGTRLSVLGAPHIRKRIQAVAAAAAGQRDRSVLFISQPVISPALLDFALRFAALSGAPKTIYRLHPGDDRQKAERAVAAAGLGADRFELSTGGGGNRTLEMQARASWQAGVYSTAVVEGLVLGCRTFLVPLPGWSALGDLVETGHARLAASPDVLRDMIAADPQDVTPVEVADELFEDEHPDALTVVTGG